MPVYDSYARLSKNPNTGELEKTDDQWADNDTVIERMGERLGEQLSDGLPAWNAPCTDRAWNDCWNGSRPVGRTASWSGTPTACFGNRATLKR